MASKIIEHRETAPIEVLAEILLFLLGEIHEPRLGKIEEGIFEDLFAIEPDDLECFHIRSNARDLAHHREEEIFRAGKVVFPGSLPFTIDGAPAVFPIEGHSRKRVLRLLLGNTVRHGWSGEHQDENKTGR